MTRTERESHLFSRQEFLDLFSEHFRIVPNKWDKESTEEFSIYDTDVDYMRLRYSLYSVEKNFKEAKIREISITTWAGGWDHKQSYIKIEWDYDDSGYNIQYTIREPDKQVIGQLHQLNFEGEKQSKDDVVSQLLKFLKFIDPNKTITLERDIKIKQILNDN